MNNAKRIIALVLVCMMIVPMAVSSFAYTADSGVTANWITDAVGYVRAKWTVYAPKANGYMPKTDKVTFTTTADKGIQVYMAREPHTRDYRRL